MQTHYFVLYNKEEVRLRLISAFKESGVSQNLLAKRVDMTQSQVSNIIRKKSFPREISLQRLAIGLRVSYRWVLSGHGSMKFYFLDYPDQEFHINFSNKLAFLIWSNGYDQLSLAKNINYSQAQIEYCIKMKRNPSGTLLDKLCSFFEVTEEWLLKENY